VVSVEIPIMGQAPATGGLAAPLGFHALIIAAVVGVSADQRVIQWKLSNPGVLQFLQTALTQLQSGRQEGGARLLARLQLAGNFIWGPEDTAPRLYLDGEALGIPRQEPGGLIRTSLKLPSGVDGAPGGEFQSWFWLTSAAGIVSVTFAPGQVSAGQPSVGTVTLNSAAPPNGAVVTLAPSSAILGAVPPSITIPAGSTSGTFQVTKTANAPGSAQDLLQVQATYEQSQAKGSLTIVPRVAS